MKIHGKRVEDVYGVETSHNTIDFGKTFRNKALYIGPPISK